MCFVTFDMLELEREVITYFGLLDKPGSSHSGHSNENNNNNFNDLQVYVSWPHRQVCGHEPELHYFMLWS